jgi:hypothetical protein
VGSHPKCGFLASPSIARLDGPEGPPSVVIAGLDGRLRAHRPDGSAAPGFPVRLIDTSLPEAARMTAESINNAAIGDLDGDGRDDVVVATNEVYGGSSSGGDVSFADGLPLTASRVYAVRSTGTASPGGDPFLEGWPIALSGIIQNVLPLIGPGHDPAIYSEGGRPRIVVSTTGGPLSIFNADGTRARDVRQEAAPGEGALNLFESAALGDVNGNGVDVVKYQVDLGQAANLALVGQNFPYSHRIGAYDARTGTTLPGWPVITDDYQFLSSSTIAQVRAGSSQQVLAGTGLGLLHAYDGVTGRDAPGFPKVTGGWLFAPAALSDDGRMAGITREGYLFEWEVDGAPACQTQWPSFRHDEQGTGNHAADGTPPGAPTQLRLELVSGDRFRLSFVSPGDDGRCGTAARYVATLDGERLDLGAPVAGGETVTRELRLPGRAGRVTVQAVDERPHLGAPASVEVVRPGGGPGGPQPGAAGAAGGSSATGAGAGRRTTAGSASDKQTAKLSVLRATIARRTRRLDVLAPITRRASGRVGVTFRAAGRTLTFSVPVDRTRGRVRFTRRLPAAMARLGTGILTLSYPGDADTRSQTVRLRAASGATRLRLPRPRIVGNRVLASGTISPRARGVVRVQIEYVVDGRTVTVRFRAPVRGGRWRLDATLPVPLRTGFAARSGTVHSYTLFTGYLPRRLRGEMRSYEVLGPPR